MVTFTGDYTSKVDDKGRVVFPSSHKCMLPPGSDMRFVVKKNIFEPFLEMYTFEEWDKRKSKVLSSLDIDFNYKHQLYWREYMRDCEIVEPDPKFGRISISRKLRDAIGVEKEVVFFGDDFRIEIWAKEKFDLQRGSVSRDEIIAIAESISRR